MKFVMFFNFSFVCMGREIFCGVVITTKNMEVVSIDLDVAAHWQVAWGDEFICLVNVLILSSFKEWSLNDT